MTNDIPRRCRIDLMTAAELAIRNAIGEVEKVGADVRLTQAVTLLSAAQTRLADYIDGVDGWPTFPAQQPAVSAPTSEPVPEKDPLFDGAVYAVRQVGKASPHILIKHLSISYGRASLLIDQLEAAGVISPKDGAKPRKVL
jgi:DNA segregation ATPase FtsK/SpoIIIE-like protein